MPGPMLNPMGAGFGDLLSMYLRALEPQMQAGPELDKRIGQYEQGANQAMGQYQQAAAQPLPVGRPNVSPLVAAGSLVGGSAAQALSPRAMQGEQPVSEMLGEQQKLDRAGLMKKREDNLMGLMKQYENQIAGAQRMGDFKVEQQARQRLETTAKAVELLRTSMTEAGETQRAEARNKTDVEVAKIRAQEAGHESAKQQRQSIAKLNDDVRQDQDLKDIITVRDYYAQGLQHFRAKNSFGDMLMIRALARAADPRTGIKEEEYNTFKGAVGHLPKLGIALTKGMVGKGMLTEAGRRRVLTRLADIYKEKRVFADRKRTMYESRAGFEGVDPKLVLSDYTIGISPQVRRQAIAAINQKNMPAFQQLLDENPDLDFDPEIEHLMEQYK